MQLVSVLQIVKRLHWTVSVPPAPGDYRAVVSGEVTFSAEEEEKEVEVSIQQDGVSEGVETFTAILSVLPGATGLQIGDQGQATATIIDSDGEFCL